MKTAPTIVLVSCCALLGCAEAKGHTVAAAPYRDRPFGDEVDDAVRAAQEEIHGCARGGGPSGTSRAIVTLAPSGAVSAVDILDRPILASTSGACATAVLRDIRLLPFSGPPYTFGVDLHVDAEPPPSEPATAAPAHATQRLSPLQIQRVVRAHFDNFRACYDQGLTRNVLLRGKVTIRFVIGLDGRVLEARNLDTGLSDVRVRACTRAAFRDLVFPKPEGGIVKVVYPIMYTPHELPEK